MQINITGKNVKITKALRDFINRKVKKVVEDFEHPIDCEVILSVEKNNRHIAELIISGDSNKFYFKKESKDLYGTIEGVIHSADLKIKKFKERQKDKNRKKRSSMKYGNNRKSTKRKSFNITTEDVNSIKPMSIEEAVLELKFLKNPFIIFRNSKDFNTYILYKSDDSDNYNIIMPQITFLGKLFNKNSGNYVNNVINYNNGKIKIVSKAKLEIERMSTNEAIEYMKQNKIDFKIFINENDEFVLLFVKSKNLYGRYFLNA